MQHQSALGPDIDGLLERLDAAADLDQFGRALCQGLLELMPAISTSYNELNADVHRIFAVIEPDPGEAWFDENQPIFERHVGEHPYLRHLASGGDGAAATWGDVCDLERFHRSRLHEAFYEPLGIYEQLMIRLPGPEHLIVGVAVNRGVEGFSEADRTLMNRLRPHLARSYRLVQLGAEQDRMRQLLRSDGWEVLLVDDAGLVISSTFADQRHIAVGAALPKWLLEPFAAALDTAAIRTGAVVGRPGVSGERVAFVVSPNKVPPHVIHVQVHAAGVATALASSGLTPRQTQVALALATGESNRQIGRRLGISEQTVKKHLEAVYRALGVSNRAAVAALVVSLQGGSPANRDLTG